MFKILCVTNRRLCREPLAERTGKLIRAGVDAVILREKDLPEKVYEQLARQVLEQCGEKLILHSFPGTAERLGVRALHLPLPVLRSLSDDRRAQFEVLGASCHSLEDVQEAERLGCSYVTLGHIFATDCKRGLPPRGLEFLEEVCRSSRIPVYAIGGITPGNISKIREAGAAGACIMSGLMACENPGNEMEALQKALTEGETE